jgi:hypothetical protein
LAQALLCGLAEALIWRSDYMGVETEDEADAIVARGFSIVLIDGRDSLAAGVGPVGFACRV